MTKIAIASGLLLVSSLFFSQQNIDKNGIFSNPEVLPVTFLGETHPWRDIVIDSTEFHPITKKPKLGYHAKSDWILNETVNPNALPKNGDPAHQKDYSFNQQRSTQIANWAGITTNTNPGDPALDVGPNHVVQMLNGSSGARVQIWNKTGTSLLGPTLFSTLAGTGAGLGDPIVLYDERADRWVLTEFSSSGNNMFIAVSTSPDPTGSYYTYTVNASSFPDYPKYSIWDDTYLITTNQNSATSYALNRTSMLAGGATNAISFTMTNFGTIGFQAAAPVSLMGTTTSGGPCLLMRMRDDAWTGSATDALEMWELDVDWSSPGSATLSQSQVLATLPHETELCGYTSFACIPQQGSGTTLDPLREILMNRVMYRNFGTHESIVCAHVTDVDGSDWAGIRWYELRRSGGAWSIYQQGTYAPDANHRWMPTIGISASGNIGLAYNVSSSSMHPEIRYTGRKECDPLGVMTETEVQLVDGTSPNNSNRWGDYNTMSVDPVDGETFWFTATYNPATQARTRVGAFRIDPCDPEVQFSSSTYTVTESDANVNNGCLDYYVINVPISIGLDPSQPADITINVTGGTATQGVDYDILNTSFTLDGSTLTGTAQIWIYNDNNTEGTETITLDYTLNANGGDATSGTLNQTVTITINDDDLAPTAMTTSVVVYSEDFEAGFGAVTTNNPSGNTPFQIGNTGTTPNGAYNIPTDNTTEFAWIDDDDCNCNQNNVDLYLPSLDLSAYTGATITFISYFEDNTYSGVNENANLTVSVNGGAFTTVGPLVASGIDVSWINQTFDVSAYVGNADVQFAINYSDGGGWLYGCAVDNFVVTANAPIDIQAAVNTGTGQTANLGPNETVHFYDLTSGDVMISLINTSSWDYGCVTVEVDRDGTAPTALQFASASVPDYLHSKTYTVVPTNNNPTGTFDITLYYKEAEVTAWETFTGNSRNNLEVIKVAGNNTINDVTPGNYASYTIDNIAATLGTFNSDVTLTASFTNGFSGFGAGIYNITATTVTHTTVNTNPSCNGGTDGSIVVTASGGSTPYQYSINGGSTWQSSNTFSGLSSGSYSVVVEENGGVQSTPSTVILTNPTTISYTATPTNATCNGGTGSISISASGGTGTLQYSVNGGSTFQSSGSFTGLAAGTYNIVVEDDNSCQATGTATITAPSAITFTATPTNPTCNTGTGSISVSASGGTGTLQYSSNGGSTFQTGSTFTGLSAGTYNIVVQDANSCQVTGTATITAPSAITFTATPINPTCNGGTGSISISASGGTGALQYSNNGGSTFQSSSTFSGLTPTTYSIVVRDANGCQTIGTATVTQPTAISMSATATNPTCSSGTGGIAITASGGTGTLQYSNNGGSTFQAGGSFTGLASGTYNLVVQDANGCQATSTATIAIPTALTYTRVKVNVLCNGQSTGSITFTASGGTGTLQYSINGGVSYQTGNTFTNLPAGLYNLSVIDANGCIGSGSATVNITQPSAISISTASTNASCGSSDGTITVTASGGTGTLQYSINGGSSFQSSGSFTGLASGSYNIVVQDANSCQATATQAVSNSSGPSVSSATGTDVTCNGGTDGSLTISATGSGTLQYSIDGGSTFGTTSSFSGLSAGSYAVLVEDGSGCQTSGGNITIGTPSAITISASSTSENCGSGDGTITITASGGTGTLQYSIDGGTSFQSSGSFTGLSANTYSVVVEDASGCQNTTSQVVSGNGGASISSTGGTDVTCNGGSDGTITITATGGTGTLQYSIDGGTTFQSSSSFTGVSAGTYSLIIEDGSGCQTSGGSVTISEPTAISMSSSATNETCGSSDGTITITASGGTGTLQYSMDGGSTFQSSGSFTGLAGGTYNLVIEDASGCQATGTQAVSSSGGPSISSSTGTDPACNGGADGSIIISATGTGTLQYSIDGGSTLSSSPSFNGLSAGTYNITVFDGNGCQTAGSSVTLSDPTAISVSASAIDASCGASDGSITITASGGTGSLQYSIDGGSSFQSSSSFNSLSSGVYSIVVQDNNSCQNTSSVTINSNGGATIDAVTTTNETCIGTGDGTATITVSGSTGTVSYSLDFGGTTQTSNTFTGLASGNYTITVSDGSGCSTNSTFTVLAPNPITIITNVTDASCGNSDGSASAIALGGTGTLSYLWDDGASQTTATATNLGAGTYTVTVTDANSCSESASVTVGNSGAATLSATGTDVSCAGGNDGTATVITSGGTSPFSYLWSDGSAQTSSTASNLSSGTYTVTVTDGASCISSTSVTISEPDSISAILTVMNTSCGQDNGLIYTTISGGASPYNYAWDDANSQTTSAATSLAAGNYNLTVTDANGCIATSSATIIESDSIVVNIDVVHESCPQAEDGSITTVVTGGSLPYTYTWSNGASTASLDSLGVDIYTLVVEDANGCSVTLVIPIENEGGDCITIPTAISPNNDGSNDTWVITGLDDYPDALVEIYNRWGSLLFSSNDYQNDWNGMYNGENVPAGVYYFIVKIDEDNTYTGSLTVIR